MRAPLRLRQLLEQQSAYTPTGGEHLQMKASYFCRLIIAVFCLALAAPMLSATAVKAADSQEVLIKKLHEFGLGVADSYNRCVKGSKAKKDIEKNSDGTYTAVYHEIDTKSITCSYKNSSNPSGPVKYIGTLQYAEVTYTCTAPSKAAAEKGPFTQRRSPTTELVKYMNGKWSY